MKINNRQEEFEKLEKKFAEEQGLPFSKILDEKERVQPAFRSKKC